MALPLVQKGHYKEADQSCAICPDPFSRAVETRNHLLVKPHRDGFRLGHSVFRISFFASRHAFFFHLSYIIDIQLDLIPLMTRRKTTPVPVRLDDATRARLRRAGKRLGATESAMIRFAILNQLPAVEAGSITLARSE